MNKGFEELGRAQRSQAQRSLAKQSEAWRSQAKQSVAQHRKAERGGIEGKMGVRWDDLSPRQKSMIEGNPVEPAVPRAQILRSSKKSDPEKIEQANFAKACKDRGWRCLWHRTDKPTTCNKGAPDFVVAAFSKTFWIEFKKPGEELRPDQGSFAKELSQNGIQMWVVNSAREAVAIIESQP